MQYVYVCIRVALPIMTYAALRTCTSSTRAHVAGTLSVQNVSGALRTGSRQKTGIEHQHSRTHIMKAIRDIEMKPILLFLLMFY